MTTSTRTNKRAGRQLDRVTGRSTSATVLGYVDGIPIVPVRVKRTRDVNLLYLATCPYCGRQHVHGGGRPDQNPRDFEGHRLSHCLQQVPGDRGYMLIVTDDDRPNLTDDGTHGRDMNRGTP